MALASSLWSCARLDGSGRNAWTVPGRLRIASTQEPATLNPLIGNQSVVVDISMLWAGYLFNYDDRGRLIPELATTVPTQQNGGISKDGRVITYHLRRNVNWQDGRPFTASDVVFTWQAIMDPRTLALTRNGYDRIHTITTPDPYIVVVHLNEPWSPFVDTFLTMSDAPIPVLPRHLLAGQDLNVSTFSERPIGTGPFKVVSWTRGQHLTLEANLGYWRGRPKLDAIDVVFLPDSNSLSVQMRAHALDLIYSAPQVQFDQLKGIPGTRVVLADSNTGQYLEFNLRQPILSDVRVRLALVAATDVDGMVARLLHGTATPATSDHETTSWAHSPLPRRPPFNLSVARELLESAGWRVGPDGIRIKHGRRAELVLVGKSGSATDERVLIHLQELWRTIGVEAAVKLYPPSLYYAPAASGGIIYGRRFDVAFAGWIGGVDPDDSARWLCAAEPPNGANSGSFCSPRVDALEADALHVYDRDRRRADYRAISEILSNDAAWLPLWYFKNINIENADLRGYHPAHAVTEFWNAWQWTI